MDGPDVADARGDLPAWAWVRDPVFGRRVTVPDQLFATVARDHPSLRPLSQRMVLQAIARRCQSRGVHRLSPLLLPAERRNLERAVRGVGYDRNLSGEVITASPA